MKKNYVLIFITFILYSSMFGQVVSIGTGNERTTGLPIDPFYRYSYTQEIYLASELNQTGEITQLTFKVTANRELNNSNDWVVYLAHTTKTQFSSTTDWVASSELTQVYAGNFSHTPGADIALTFTTPFNYNGTDNLLLVVEDNSSGFDSGSDDLLASSVSGNRAIMYRSDTVNPDPASPPTATNIQAFVANVDIHFGASNSCATAQDTIDDDFESYAAGTGAPLPDCWSSIGTGMTIGNRNTGGEANSGTKYISAYVGFANNQHGYIVSPKLSTIDGNHEADFFIKTSIPGATYELGTMTDPTDSTTFTSIGSATALTTAYTNVNTGNVPATSDTYFAIRFSAPVQHTVVRIDDFKWQTSTLSRERFTQDHFSMYPNPSKNGLIHIQFHTNFAATDSRITVYNAIGKQVYTTVLKTDRTIDLSSLTSGVYLVKIQSDSAVTTKKLILD